MKAVSPKMVAIKAFPIEDDGLIKKTEKSQEAAMKKQNRGEVIMAGKDCVFVTEGDTVSFYRNASTTVKDDNGEEYEIVNEGHILVKF